MPGNDMSDVDNNDVAPGKDAMYNPGNEHVRAVAEGAGQLNSTDVRPGNISDKVNHVRGVSELATPLAISDENGDNATPRHSWGKRLSASAERFDLEYSLGSLNELSVPPSLGTSKRKKLTHNTPMGSVGEALMPTFWQDSASVSENNIASASFDVAEEEGGSSPLSIEGLGVSAEEKYAGNGRASRDLNDEEKRGIMEAEEVMKLAFLAAQPDTFLAANDTGYFLAKKNGDKSEAECENNLDDFARQAQDDIQDNGSDNSNNFSSASSLVESYNMPEDEYSMPFPPAPPSTPAAPKDAFIPLPFQACASRGKLSYGGELRRNDLQGTSNNATRPHQDDDFPLPLSPRNEDNTQLPEESDLSRSRLSRKYHGGSLPPDLSGAVTEPRRGNSFHTGKQRPRQSTMTDFDKWDVGDRYQLKRILGRGSYGEVAKAIDLQVAASHQKTEGAQSPQQNRAAYVAVKKISNAFDQEVDAIRLFREMHILRRLRGHACVIQLVDVIRPRSSDLEHFHDLYLVFEYVDTDLYKLIMSPQYLTTEHIQTFLYQLLVGLKYIHSSSGEFDLY
jgi:hypothetical protein